MLKETVRQLSVLYYNLNCLVSCSILYYLYFFFFLIKNKKSCLIFRLAFVVQKQNIGILIEYEINNVVVSL